MSSRIQKQVDVTTARELLRVFWPDFVEDHGCIIAEFQRGITYDGWDGPRTETESFLNHTHVFGEFSNSATSSRRKPISPELSTVDEQYDEKHPDFFAACEVGMKMAKLWATKLKADYPKDRFRVYYTEFDNPIVRFHKVRSDEPVWLSDADLLAATDPSFLHTIIYDTSYFERPVLKVAKERTS